MARTPSLAAALVTFGLLGYAAVPGCSSDEPAECSKDSDCKAASTGCTIGVCQATKCVGKPIADGTRVADQTPVKDKWCVVLKCKAGVATETADGSKTPADVPACQKAECDGTTLKTVKIADGVPCEGGGACLGGKCELPADTGPRPDTGTPTDTGAPADGGGADEAGADASGADAAAAD
jgi:hypothetical protein